MKRLNSFFVTIYEPKADCPIVWQGVVKDKSAELLENWLDIIVPDLKYRVSLIGKPMSLAETEKSLIEHDIIEEDEDED
jgi:uncharacterized Fe-S radical SAM superfamily protein PflX